MTADQSSNVKFMVFASLGVGMRSLHESLPGDCNILAEFLQTDSLSWCHQTADKNPPSSNHSEEGDGLGAPDEAFEARLRVTRHLSWSVGCHSCGRGSVSWRDSELLTNAQRSSSSMRTGRAGKKSSP